MGYSKDGLEVVLASNADIQRNPSLKYKWKVVRSDGTQVGDWFDSQELAKEYVDQNTKEEPVSEPESDEPESDEPDDSSNDTPIRR